jgi:hypothetical protein
MENKIFKYVLKVQDEQAIKMPIGAVVLSVQFQRGVLSMWAIVNPNNEDELRCFEVYGTGADFPSLGMAERKHLATVQEGPFVWHVFEPIK